MRKYPIFVLLLALLNIHLLQAQAVSFEIRNERTANGNYEFDVYMAADQWGTFHSRGQVYVNLDVSAFGTEPVRKGHVKITPLHLLKESFAGAGKYATLNLSDNAPGIMASTWQGNFLSQTPSAAFHTEVPQGMTPLYHFSVKLQDPNASPKVSLNAELMRGQQFYLLGTKGKEKAYREGKTAPFAFLSFSAEKANEHDVQLNWSTQQEGNSDYFVIEKKKGAESFEVLAKTTARNEAGASFYEYLDRSGMANAVTYRVKQVDREGGVLYSETRTVHFEDLVKNDRFVVFPNPATEVAYLKALSGLDEDFQYFVSDMQGRVLLQGSLPESGKVKISLQNLAEGTYIVKTVSPAGKAYLNKLVKVTQ